MLIRKPTDLGYSDVTPKSVYTRRREFLRVMGIAGAAAFAGAAAWRLGMSLDEVYATSKLEIASKSPFSTTEKETPYNDVTHYNNFYEFGTDKTDPAKNAQKFRTSPWTVSVEGEVKKPRKFSMDEMLKIAPLDERIYRHRCVEAWSIVVPWIGFPFSELAKLVEPTSNAQFVAFESFFDPGQMPQAKYSGLDYPYVEGLRLDEAMNPLTLVAVGMYGEKLPNKDGPPGALVWP